MANRDQHAEIARGDPGAQCEEPAAAVRYPARVRFRAGVVGERLRVVHVAVRLPGGDYRTLCELVLRGSDAEEISDLLGMPCMVCTRVLALRSRCPAEAVVSEQGAVESAAPEQVAGARKATSAGDARAVVAEVESVAVRGDSGCAECA